MHSSNTHPAVAWTITVFGLAWATFMLAVTINNIYQWGFCDEFRHFTNWAWIIAILFLYATSGSLLVVTYRLRGALRSWTCAIFAIFFIPAWLTAVVVLLVVLLMLLTGATFLQNILRSTPLYEVIIGNELMHLVPVVTYIVVALVNTRLLYWSLNEMLARVSQDRKLFWAIVFAEVFITPNIPLLFYRVFNDPAVVYGETVNQYVGVAYILGLEAIFGGLPFFVAVTMFGLGSRHIKEEFIDGNNFIPEAMIIASSAHQKQSTAVKYIFN